MKVAHTQVLKKVLGMHIMPSFWHHFGLTQNKDHCRQ